MPELPEIETFSRNLRPDLVGRRVVGVHLLWSRSLETPAPEVFQVQLTGQTIRETGRRGKFFILTLGEGYLLMHLRMSGDLRMEQDVGDYEPHDRLILSLDNGTRLAFNDTRKFGRVWLVEDPAAVLGNLGPEPLDEAFTAAVLYQKLQSCRRQLKPLLLDQSFIAGLGNIYTDESLHRARLHPLACSRSVSAEQAAALWQAIRDTLQEGIRRQGTSIDWVYRGGDFQKYLRVYQRTGQPCLQCGTPIEHILVGQRSTHYCPTCQPYIIS